MGKTYKRMTCSERRALIQNQLNFSFNEKKKHIGVFCVHVDLKSSDNQEVIDNSISRVVDCSCVFDEDCQLLYVAGELDLEDRIQEFMTRYPVELAEEFASMPEG